jgi:exonuclease III
LNIRSLGNKLDDLLDVRRDQSLDVMCLVETWHDSDSVCLRRLRVDGMQVVDRPRPRVVVDTVTTNHGGVAIVAMPGVRLSQLDVGVKPTTFEHVCARVASGPSACVTAVIYRPGSAAVTATFFDELSDLLDRLATLVEPIYVVGDCNVRTDLPDDLTAIQFRDILAAHGLSNYYYYYYYYTRTSTTLSNNNLQGR